jgi:hypothetical protein
MAADLGVDYLVEAVFNVPTLADATPAKRRCASNAAGLGPRAGRRLRTTRRAPTASSLTRQPAAHDDDPPSRPRPRAATSSTTRPTRPAFPRERPPALNSPTASRPTQPNRDDQRHRSLRACLVHDPG